jgi:hypothetical protein
MQCQANAAAFVTFRIVAASKFGRITVRVFCARLAPREFKLL